MLFRDIRKHTVADPIQISSFEPSFEFRILQSSAMNKPTPTQAPSGDPNPRPISGASPLASTLSPKEFANRFGKSRRTVYRWLSEGVIPDRFLDHTGLREVRISIEAVDYLRETFREGH
jgi:excisionase family DNA binding protein